MSAETHPTSRPSRRAARRRLRANFVPPHGGIPCHGQSCEEEEGAAAADAIRQPSAWILEEAVEQILAGAEETNDETTGTERREIRRYVRLPQLLTQRQSEEAGGQNGNVAIEP